MHSNESMIQVCVNTVPGPVQSTKKNISYIHHHLPPGALHLRCHLLQGRLCLLSVDCYWTSDQRQPCQMITMLNEPKTILFDTICGKSMETYLKKIHLRISCINSIDANPIRHRETFSPPRVWPQHLTMTWKVVEESRPAMNCFSRFPNKGVLLKGK